MTEWLLIALIAVSGFIKGIDIDTVGKFQTEEACQAVAKQLKEIHEAKFDSRKLITLCVPTALEIEPGLSQNNT